MLYDANDLNKLAAKRRVHIIAVIAVAVIAIAACVLLCVFADHDNKTVMTVLASVILVMGGWFIIGDVYIVLLPYKHRTIHIETVLEQDKTTARGTVKSIMYITVSKYMSAYEIMLDTDDGVVRYLWNDEIGKPTVNVGDTVRLTVAGRYITDCEAQNGD